MLIALGKNDGEGVWVVLRRKGCKNDCGKRVPVMGMRRPVGDEEAENK